MLSSLFSQRRQAASIGNRRVEANSDSIRFRDMLTRLCHMHGRFDVHATDDVDDFETALSTLIADEFDRGLREGGAILQHPAARPA